MSGFLVFSHLHGGIVDSAKRGGEVRRTQTDMYELEARLDRAELVCEALWTLMRDKLGVTDEQLISRINDIDLSDGKLDGKVRKAAVACPKCHRQVGARFAKCMYCGQPVPKDLFA